MHVGGGGDVMHLVVVDAVVVVDAQVDVLVVLDMLEHVVHTAQDAVVVVLVLV